MRPPVTTGADGSEGVVPWRTPQGVATSEIPFATTPGPVRRRLRRLAWELVLIVIAKVAVLCFIWWLVIHPHPRPDASPAALDRLLAPAGSSPPPSQEAKP